MIVEVGVRPRDLPGDACVIERSLLHEPTNTLGLAAIFLAGLPRFLVTFAPVGGNWTTAGGSTRISICSSSPLEELPRITTLRLSVAAAIIEAAVSAIRPCTSPLSTLYLRAALSVGSAQLVYWSVTSSSSFRTCSVVGIGGNRGKSNRAMFLSKGGFSTRVEGRITGSEACSGVL